MSVADRHVILNCSCLLAYNLPWKLPWTVTRISIGHPLISVDLPIYDLPCGVSIAPVLRNCVGLIAGLALFASFAPTAKCTASHTRSCYFQVVLLRFWCDILHINDCAVFVVIVICRYTFSVFFLLQISTIGAHLTNCVHIWSLSVGLTKCAAHKGNRVAHLTNWSNALRDCPNVQIGQMRLTVPLRQAS